MAETTFVIRIWCEHSEQESVKPQFRGVVEHVFSGQRQYIANTQSISEFIQNHLPNASNKKIDEPHTINQWIDTQDR